MQNWKWQYSGEEKNLRGRFSLYSGETLIMSAWAQAFHADGRRIDTREAELKSLEETCDGKGLVLKFADENGLCLTEYLEIGEKGVPTASCTLSAADGSEVQTRKLIPMVVGRGRGNTLGIWNSMWTKMLQVPYDNDMSLRYEAVPLRCGRKSYDLTVLFREDTREGLLVGAADFDTWKNALVGSSTDEHHLCAQSGIADEGTHDTAQHGIVSGTEVKSSRFYVLYGSDYRDLLETYGSLVRETSNILTWEEGVPFGFNSWAALAFRLNADNYQKSGAFLRDVLRPAGYENKGLSYANLDSGWSVIPEDTLTALVDELHANGQKAGIYDPPFAFWGDEKDEIPGLPGHIWDEILLHDEMGRLLPRADGARPLDVTHPLWKEMTAKKLENFVKWNFDYVKFDFMSHAAVEGVHYDRNITTGRQAINMAYGFIRDYLAEERIGRPFFISLSIAPLFPCGYGHARRFSCDAFGTYEDVEYVLNAQTYTWWQNGTVYQFNDADHICLLKSFSMQRDSTEGEARARYTAAVISGGVMMLSDDYEREDARTRTIQFATNRAVNAIAASGIAFRPVEAADSSASSAYTAVINGRQCIALFHWKQCRGAVVLDCERAGLKAGVTYRELWSGDEVKDENGVITWMTENCDAVLLEEI